MYLLIVFLPLLSGLLVLVTVRYLGEKGYQLLRIMLVVMWSSVSWVWVLFYEVGESNCYLLIEKWIGSELLLLLINWGFIFDSLTVTMLIVVINMALLVNMYVMEYIDSSIFINIKKKIKKNKMKIMFIFFVICLDELISMNVIPLEVLNSKGEFKFHWEDEAMKKNYQINKDIENHKKRMEEMKNKNIGHEEEKKYNKEIVEKKKKFDMFLKNYGYILDICVPSLLILSYLSNISKSFGSISNDFEILIEIIIEFFSG
jgi:hypothetical protein